MTGVERLRPLITTTAVRYGLDPLLVEAMVIQESGGITSAVRYERGFWDRYLAADPKYKDKDPLRVSSSYGLMQVMYPVAAEQGFPYEDPEYLCVPSIGLDIGCRTFKNLLTWAQGNEDQALAAYNGGKGGNTTPPFRNQTYVERVRRHQQRLRGVI